MKAPLILVVSKKMDANKKSDRQEDKLIRIGGKARKSLGLADETSVELWPQGSDEDRINRSKELEIFQAYTDELRDLKTKMSQEDFCRAGFVTSKTFKYICKDSRKKKQNIWIADTIEDTIVGADPEFLLIRDDGIIKYAGSIRGFHHSDDLGSDGPWAEVRPKPSVDVESFIKNTRKILKTHPNRELIEDYQWITGCYLEGDIDGDPSHGRRELGIGGHIHIGTPHKLAKEIQKYYNDSGGYRETNLYKDAVYSCLKKVLDEYIAIPAIKLDGIKNTILRRKSYGAFSDIRTNHGRLEYRTLSGEWFSHPELARAVIGAVKAVSHAFFKTLDDGNYEKKMIMTSAQQGSSNYEDFYFFDTSFSNWKSIEIMKEMGTTKTSNVMTKILDKGEIEFNRAYFQKLGSMFKGLPTYKEYSEYLDYFLEIVSLSDKVLKDRDKELKNTWVGKSKFIL